VAARDSFSFRANGSLTGDCYGAALRPYRVVTARGVDGPLAGTYLITRVAHRLTRSTYTQTFELIRNATSNPAGRAGMPGGAIF